MRLLWELDRQPEGDGRPFALFALDVQITFAAVLGVNFGGLGSRLYSLPPLPRFASRLDKDYFSDNNSVIGYLIIMMMIDRILFSGLFVALAHGGS